MEKLEAGTYCFDCNLMPWTLYELEDKGNDSMSQGQVSDS